MLIWAWYLVVLANVGTAGCLWLFDRSAQTALTAVWRRRLTTTATVIAALVVTASAARLWAQTYQAFGGDQPLTWLLVRVIVTETPWGRGWTWQALGALLCVVTALTLRRRWHWWPLFVVSAVATGFFTALNGHAVGMETGVWITVLAHGTHVVAAGLWLGTLALLLMVTSPEAPINDGESSEGAAFVDLIDRFSPMALSAVGALVTAGLVATWRHVGTPANMVSPYGLVLGLKIGAFVAAAVCGWINWRSVRPTLRFSGAAQRRLRRLAWLEITFGTIAVALTAVLGLLSMPGHDH